MYNLPYYKDDDEKVIKKFIDDNPFAFITGCNAENKPVATQIPVFIEEENGNSILRGHMMKNTDHHKAFMKNPNVLVVFSGAHTYVSGTWYSNPHTASTWNYMSVHAHGKISFLGEKELLDVLRKTSLHFENYNEKSETALHNLPDDFIQKAIQAIVAFEIVVTDMNHVFKLSQDRDAESYANIINKLKELGGDSSKIAHEMEVRKDKLFSNIKQK